MERQPVKLIPPASQTKANQEEAHGDYVLPKERWLKLLEIILYIQTKLLDVKLH